MKSIILLFVCAFVAVGCKSDKDISPGEVWSAGCVTFGSDDKGYKLSGICCAYVIVPKISIKSNNSFSSSATYYTFTGAGFQELPVTIHGKLSEDRKSLDLSYEVDGKIITFELSAGGPNMACLCGCD